MSTLDSLADKARAKSEQLAGQGGIKDKLAEELAEDAEFLRKLKPELIKKRVKGEAPTDQRPTEVKPPAPSGPQLGARPKPAKKKESSGGGPSPFVVIGAALILGVALAKWLDWRGHAHPRW
ncbi:MAG TPA: hypothetical protein VGK79_17780 [Gaiellaceae bacterium]|jgi:hypothetical protein